MNRCDGWHRLARVFVDFETFKANSVEIQFLDRVP